MKFIIIVRSFFAILTIGIFSTDLYSQNDYKIDKEGFFPFSVWYSGGKVRATMLSDITPESREEWKHDIQQIKSLGFNSIKTWVEWSHNEPIKGEYNFENLKMILELAEDAGLRVIIQVYGESAPDWVGKENPDGLFEAQDGYRIKPQIAPGYCIDDRGVEKSFIAFYKETSRIAVQYPSFYGWDLWSEPHIVQWGSPDWIENPQYCFCPNTQERFRDWLQSKYSSLNDLNKSWYRNFEKWDEVEAPRFGTILTYSDFMDWKAFNYQKMAEDLKLRYDAVRTYDKTHVATAHASPPSLFSSPYRSTEDDFLMSDQVDFYGLSQYPKHNQPGDWVPWRFMAGADFSYSANIKNGGYYVGEFQAGFGTVGLNVGDPVTPEDHRIWVLSSLATGAKGIFAYAYYPMSAGYESGGYGLIDLDGTITDRAVELGKLAKLIDAHKDLFSNSVPVKAEVAILYNPLSQMVGGQRRVGDKDGHINSLIGYYRFLSDQNVPVNFIHRNQVESGDLSQYKLIIAPYSLMLTQKAADGLTNFVKNGGSLMSEARLAWNDEKGKTSDVIPGLGLDNLFKIRETKVQTLPEVLIKTEGNSFPTMSYLNSKDTIMGSLFAESLEPRKESNVKVLGSLDDGSPVIVASKYGKGQTIYIGSFLALANSRGALWDQSTQRITVQDSANMNTDKFIRGLVNWAKIKRPFIVKQSKESNNSLVVRLHENKNGNLLYILNHGKTNEKALIKLNVNKNGNYLLHELMSNKEIKLDSKHNFIEFNTSNISPKNGEIWQIEMIKKM